MCLNETEILKECHTTSHLPSDAASEFDISKSHEHSASSPYLVCPPSERGEEAILQQQWDHLHTFRSLAHTTLIFTIHWHITNVHLLLIHIQLILINRIVSTLTLTRISFFIFQVDHFHIIVAFIDIDNPMLWLIPFYNAASYDRSTRQGSGVQIRMDSGCQRGSYVEMGKCDLM